jgi:hypothetical protein
MVGQVGGRVVKFKSMKGVVCEECIDFNVYWEDECSPAVVSRGVC